VAHETPKVDPVSKLVTVVAVVLLVIAIVYLVQSLLSTIKRNTTVGETVETPVVAQAEPEPSATEAAPAAPVVEDAAPVVEDTAALVETVASIAGDAVGGAALYQSSCASCHGLNAEGQGIFPKLVGQTADEIAANLRAYRAGEKTGGNAAMMTPVAAGLSDQDIANLAAHIAALGGVGEEEALAKETAAPAVEEEAPAAVAATSGDVAAGQQKYVQTCASCHGMQGEGQGIFPKLAGQTAEKIAADLRAYRAGEKTGPMAGMMAPMAAGLSDGEIDNLAAFISGL